MTSIPFSKFQGFGNDYIVIERGDIASEVDISDLARSICHRTNGAGSDGIAVIERIVDGDADFSCEIVNPDGSIAGFSGNGTRCAVAYLHWKGIWQNDDLRLKTRSGVKNYHLLEGKGTGEFWFEAEIGKPRFSSDEIPVLTDTLRETVIDEPIEIDDRHYTFSAINVGNPVACVFVDNLNFDWQNVGKSVESHAKFPDRVNVVFVKVIDRGNIELRIWERGAGETSASGTCSSGAAVLSAFLLKTERTVKVHSPGGMTEVVWREDDEMVITGRADLSYSGEWPF